MKLVEMVYFVISKGYLNVFDLLLAINLTTRILRFLSRGPRIFRFFRNGPRISAPL